MVRFSCIVLFLLCSPFTPAAGLPAAKSFQFPKELQNLVIALRPDNNPDAMLAQRQSLEEFIREQAGLPARTSVPLSGAVIQNGLRNGSIDVAFVSATDMILARDRATILLAAELNGNPWYLSYWVTLADAPFQTVEDLRGQPVAFSSRTSTSGYVVPVWDMHRRGLINRADELTAFFGRNHVWFGTGYVSAIEQVLRGEAAAAAVSYYVLDKDRHLTLEQKSRLRMLQSQGPVPTHVLAVRNTLPGEVIKELRRLFLMLNQPGFHELRDDLFNGPLIEVEEQDHLAGLSAAMQFVRP